MNPLWPELILGLPRYQDSASLQQQCQTRRHDNPTLGPNTLKPPCQIPAALSDCGLFF